LATITLNRKVLIKVIVSQEFKDSFIKQLEVLLAKLKPTLRSSNLKKVNCFSMLVLLSAHKSLETLEQGFQKSVNLKKQQKKK